MSKSFKKPIYKGFDSEDRVKQRRKIRSLEKKKVKSFDIYDLESTDFDDEINSIYFTGIKKDARFDNREDIKIKMSRK